MKTDTSTSIELMPCEIETARRAAKQRGKQFDPAKTQYSATDLEELGMVREGYTREELRERGVTLGSVSCHDSIAREAESVLPVETPYGSGIRKWQLPFDMMPLRVMKTVFPPNTKVSAHVHPSGSAENPGGGLRIVTKGSISYKGQEYGVGDWFYIENGSPYEFTTSSQEETECMYTYGFFAWTEGNRFSHPHDA